MLPKWDLKHYLSPGKLVAATIIVFLTVQAAALTIRPYKVTCGVEGEVLEYINCSLRAVNRQRAVLNADTILTTTLTNIIVNIKLFKKESVSYQPFLVDANEDLCKCLKYGTGTFAPMLLPAVKKVSNINHTCPYHKGPIFVRELYLDPKNIPMPLPGGNYKLRFSIFRNLSSPSFIWLNLFLNVGE